MFIYAQSNHSISRHITKFINIITYYSTFLGRPVTDTEVQAFALEDERSWVDDEVVEIDEDDEDNDELFFR